MSPVTTHVLDTARGRPAARVPVRLEIQEGDAWKTLGTGVTNSDGRCANLIPGGHSLQSGTYRLIFDTGQYFAGLGTPTFYPQVQILFEVASPNEHYHVPLLLSPFGYSTYRGS